MYALFSEKKSCFYTEKEAEAVSEIYAQCQKISVDFGIMEKAENVFVLPADIQWSDVGTWKSLYEISEKNETGNVVNAEALLYETKNCIIKGDKKHLIIAQGLENFIIVEHDNVILICQKDQEQRIKQFLGDAKDKFGLAFE
jgi:mannose-1-phosphate guanylyltransferase